MQNRKEIFSKRIKQVREQAGLSQDDLAQKLNITRGTIGHWENQRREPDIQMLCDLADALGADVDFLLGRKDSPT